MRPARNHDGDICRDEELDAPPFGVIALDGEGRIARYNMAEARFARLDRGQVLGRSFFGEVARCTDTPEFRGRFEQVNTAIKTKLRFEWVFAFRFGAQRVDVDMGSLSKAPTAVNAPRVDLCINRRKFMPRQKDVPEAIEAPLIAELEPDVEAAGVVRDAQARRRIEVDLTMLEALFGTLTRRDKLGASTLLREWGTASIGADGDRGRVLPAPKSAGCRSITRTPSTRSARRRDVSAVRSWSTVRRWHAAFRWEPPAIDPVCLTASAFLALLDDLAADERPPTD